jgi:uncharacterized protein (TIGR02677 family)
VAEPGDFNPNRYRDPALRQEVREASFLTAENVARYRLIIRYFCDEMEENQRDWLSPEEIVAFLQAAYDPGYSMVEAEYDLGRLAAWNNLIAEQDRARARTVEEFKRRRLIYHVTERTVALDRLTRAFDTGRASSAVLDSSMLERLWARLDAIRYTFEARMPEQPRDEFIRQEIWGPWSDAFTLFETLRTSANDFHHALRAASTADMNSTDDFLIYKDVLLRNLDGFIVQLAEHASRIRQICDRFEESGISSRMVTLLTRYQIENVADPTGLLDRDEVRAKFDRQCRALADWFQPGRGADVLRRTTAHAIRSVARRTQRMVDRNRVGASRARDLERLATAFAACRTPDDAHALAALTLGCALSRHLRGSFDWHELTTGRPVWFQPAHEVALRKIYRGRRRSLGGAAPVRDSREAIACMLEAQLRREAEAARTWSNLFENGALRIDRVVVDDTTVRDTLLTIIGECLAAPDWSTAGPDGRRVHLSMPHADEPLGEIVAPDGVLVGPMLTLTQAPYGAGA